MQQILVRYRIYLIFPTLALVLLIGYLGERYYPPGIELEAGFLSPIVAFELGTTGEIDRLLKDPDGDYGRAIRQAFDAINYAYFSFLFF